MIDKRARQERIRKILAHNEIHSQEQLQDLLAAEDIPVTQATLSRDLRDIGAVRGTNGYLIQTDRAGAPLDTKALDKSLRGLIQEASRGGTLVVLRTEGGFGHAVSQIIDAARLPQVLGTMAAPDTVFVATGSSGEARELLRILRRSARSVR